MLKRSDRKLPPLLKGFYLLMTIKELKKYKKIRIVPSRRDTKMRGPGGNCYERLPAKLSLNSVKFNTLTI